MPVQQIANSVEIAVGIVDEVFDQFLIKARFVLHFADYSVTAQVYHWGQTTRRSLIKRSG